MASCSCYCMLLFLLSKLGLLVLPTSFHNWTAMVPTGSPSDGPAQGVWADHCVLRPVGGWGPDPPQSEIFSGHRGTTSSPTKVPTKTMGKRSNKTAEISLMTSLDVFNKARWWYFSKVEMDIPWLYLSCCNFGQPSSFDESSFCCTCWLWV